jgi:hypothetical protein
MGFNLGSTKLRQRWTGEVHRHIFESPLIRLMKDHQYQDIYEHGREIPADQKVPARSVWIYRYYEPVSEALGSGKRPEIENYAEGLADLLEQMRDQICGEEGSQDPAVRAARESFKVHIVAHSMGGLIVRCYLQNIAKKRGISPPVDKVFTYATPHGGIDFRLVGNVPSFLQYHNIENFNEERMREYLVLPAGEPVTSLGGAFPSDRFFCLVGTNHRDYGAAHGLSRAAVGPMSDGLVQIANAVVEGAPRAFVHRSHSGHYGIVNSEEGYQNLRRFLFGQVRVDGLLEIDDISLPPKVERKRQAGREVRASYHIEVIARVRGEQWDLHRRTVDGESAIFVPFKRIRDKKPVYLLSGFLLDVARVSRPRRSLGFSLDLGVMVPEYEVDRRWWRDDHHDGGYIFRDKVNLEVTLGADMTPVVRYGFDSKTPNRATRQAAMTTLPEGRYEFRIPVSRNTRPGLTARLLLRTRAWA